MFIGRSSLPMGDGLSADADQDRCADPQRDACENPDGRLAERHADRRAADCADCDENPAATLHAHAFHFRAAVRQSRARYKPEIRDSLHHSGTTRPVLYITERPRNAFF